MQDFRFHYTQIIFKYIFSSLFPEETIHSENIDGNNQNFVWISI